MPWLPRPDLVHVTVPGGPEDPRDLPPDPPGVVVHRVPELHPDDVCVHRGLRVTTPMRTVIDCAESLPADELRAMVLRTIELGLFDRDAYLASRGRVEWRPSLALLDAVMAELL